MTPLSTSSPSKEPVTVAISSITNMELIRGCRDRHELAVVSKFLGRFETIHFNEPISALSIDLITQYNLSHGLLIADAIIAATAIVYDHGFVTKNQRDFRFIEKLKLLPYPDTSKLRK
jgi:predicted nucleic acid-binding protein